MMAVLTHAEIDKLIFRASSLHGYLNRAEKVLEKLGPDHPHWNEWLRPDELRARESDPEWQWSFAGAFVQAVINVAEEFRYNPGEFATFITDWPRRYLPASASAE